MTVDAAGRLRNALSGDGWSFPESTEDRRVISRPDDDGFADARARACCLVGTYLLTDS
jgi:hypothetical protein